MSRFLVLGALAFAFTLSFGVLSDRAETAGGSLLMQFAQADTADYSEGQLEAYVDAVVKIQEIDQAWQPRIEGAQTSGEAAALTREATEKMIAEVEAQGLTVDEYNSITQAAEQDDQLYERIIALLAERR